MVTAGANQAFVNIVLTLVDASDRVVLFKPYYFNHIMALQMTGGAEQVGQHQHTIEQRYLTLAATYFCLYVCLNGVTVINHGFLSLYWCVQQPAGSFEAANVQVIQCEQHAAPFIVPGPDTGSILC